MQQLQWQDRFNIGVEIVDQAHRRLFSIVQKIMELYVEKHEDKLPVLRESNISRHTPLSILRRKRPICARPVTPGIWPTNGFTIR